MFISDPKQKGVKPTCEILSKVLLQLNCLVKHFIGLLICLPLIHFPEKDKFWLVPHFTYALEFADIFITMCTKLQTYIRASMDFGLMKMAIG